MDAGAVHLPEGALRHADVVGVVEGGEGPGEPDALVERADREQPGVAGELAWRWFEDERGAKEVQDMWPGGWYTHRRFPGRRNDLSAEPV
jgi:hypothetical protein